MRTKTDGGSPHHTRHFDEKGRGKSDGVMGMTGGGLAQSRARANYILPEQKNEEGMGSMTPKVTGASLSESLFERDPFHSSVSVDERLKTIREWNLVRCHEALAWHEAGGSVQASVLKALDARVRALTKAAAGRSTSMIGPTLKAYLGRRVRILTRGHEFIGVLRDVDDTGEMHSSAVTLTEPACGYYQRSSGKFVPKPAVSPYFNQVTQAYVSDGNGAERRVL